MQGRPTYLTNTVEVCQDVRDLAFTQKTQASQGEGEPDLTGLSNLLPTGKRIFRDKPLS